MELIDCVDKQGQPTGQIVSREKAHRKGILHRTAHVWIARPIGKEFEVLLQKRAKNKDIFPCHYDISSAGHIPTGNNPKLSAIRELYEELGITATEKDLINCGKIYNFVRSRNGGVTYKDHQISDIFLLIRDFNETDIQIQEEELESTRWFKLSTLVILIHQNLIRHCIDSREITILKRVLDSLSL